MPALEDQINQLEIRNHQPLSQIAYYKPDRTYYTPHQPAPGISPTINVPPPSRIQWTGQAAFHQKRQYPRKRVRNGYQWGGHQTFQFSHSPNITYHNQAPPYQIQQPMRGRDGCGGCRQGRRGGTVNMQANHTNKIKQFHNLHCCFTCGGQCTNIFQPGSKHASTAQHR